MSDWWQNLGDAARIFWCIAVGASVFQVLLLAGSFFADSHGDDVSDSHHSGHVGLFKMLSLRTVVAFLVGFGWAGALHIGSGSSLLTALFVAGLTGLIFMVVIHFLMRSLLSLKADGTLDYTNAIGQTGQVYITIPAAGTGQGQVEIMIQGRLTTAQAVTPCEFPLSPQTSVLVQDVEDKSLLVVAPF